MGEKKITIKKTVDSKQIAAFLRLLAAELEGEGTPAPNTLGVQLHDFNKLKIGLIKEEGGQLLLSLKVKNTGRQAHVAAPEFVDTAEQEYQPFKQGMKSTFSDLARCGEQGILPSVELLARFMAQSEKLVSFTGFGDQYYEDYTKACAAMKQAVEAGSAAAFQEKLAALTALKKACHQRFK